MERPFRFLAPAIQAFPQLCHELWAANLMHSPFVPPSKGDNSSFVLNICILGIPLSAIVEWNFFLLQTTWNSTIVAFFTLKPSITSIASSGIPCYPLFHLVLLFIQLSRFTLFTNWANHDSRSEVSLERACPWRLSERRMMVEQTLTHWLLLKCPDVYLSSTLTLTEERNQSK